MLLLSIGHLGGGPETVRLLAKYLDRTRYEISVVCPESATMKRLAEIPDVKRFTLPFPTTPRPGIVRQIASLIKSERVDILHTHLFHGDLYGFLATRLTPVPLLLSTVQGINFFWESESFPRRAQWWLASKAYRGIYRVFDGIATCSDAVRGAICARPGLKVGRDRVCVIHNSADMQEVQAAAARTPAPVRGLPDWSPSRRKRLITVANFECFKGHRILLQALKRLSSDLSFECLLVGDGPERPAMEVMAANLGLSNRVRFLGYRDDVPSLLRQCDLFVLPSLWEPFGIAMVEAMVLGVPVVACCAGGVPEIITDGETGVLVTPGSPLALAEGICRVLSDQVFAARLAAQARKIAEGRFDARGMAGSYERWYRKLITKERRGHDS